MHVNNDKKKYFVLIHSPKIIKVSQGISFCLAAIIENNNNDIIRFYLRDIIQAYIKIASDLNLDFYIQLLFKLISQLSASFNSIVKVMRPLYNKPKTNNHRFTIYYLYYKEKPGMIEFTHNSFLFRPPPKLLSPSDTSFDSCNSKNLPTTFFLAYNSNICIAKPGMVNGFNLRFVIKQTLNMQSYEGQEIDKIR